MERRGIRGGIRALLELTRRHRGALEFDWRARLHLPLTEVGRSVSWGEACRLTDVLRGDPSTQVCAALMGWDFPVTHEWLVAVSLRDAFVQANFRDPKPFPKPFPTAGGPSVEGAAADQVLTQGEIDRALREMAGR